MLRSNSCDTARIFLLAVSLLAVARPAFAEPPAATIPTTSEADGLLDLVMARAQIIKSLHLEYTFRESPGPDPNIAAHAAEKLTLAFAENYWLVRHHEGTSFRAGHPSMSLIYTETEQAGGEPTRALEMSGPVTLTDLMHERAAFAAHRLGTLWFAEQIKYIDEHRHSARWLPSSTVHDIPVAIVEWEVALTDFDEAFLIIPLEIAKAGVGKLRLYISARHHGALPRIEYVAPDDKVHLQIDAIDFRESASEVSFPRAASCLIVGQNDEKSAFTVESVLALNSPLRDDIFTPVIPVGTRVHDRRPGVPASIFTVRSEKEQTDIEAEFAPPIADDAHDTWNPFWIGINLGLLFVAYLIWRIQRWNPLRYRLSRLSEPR